jgi:hypothetical protein
MAGMDTEELRQILDYWKSKRRGRRMPARGDIDPLEIPGKLWPRLSLLDIVRENGLTRFRYRRVGSHFVETFGQDPTGRFIDETLATRGRYRQYVISLYHDLITARAPIYSENMFWVDGAPQSHKLTKRLILPLSNDDQDVDIILVAHVVSYVAKSAAEAPMAPTEFMEGTRIVLDPDA